jgi:hypothetical protein
MVPRGGRGVGRWNRTRNQVVRRWEGGEEWNANAEYVSLQAQFRSGWDGRIRGAETREALVDGGGGGGGGGRKKEKEKVRE